MTLRFGMHSLACLLMEDGVAESFATSASRAWRLPALNLPDTYPIRMSEEPKTSRSRHALSSLDTIRTILSKILLRISAFPYYFALQRNTLDAVDAIGNAEDPDERDVLVRRFLRFEINDIKYVQVAVSAELLNSLFFERSVGGP